MIKRRLFKQEQFRVLLAILKFVLLPLIVFCCFIFLVLNTIQPDLKKKLMPYYVDAVAPIMSLGEYPIIFYSHVGTFFSDWLVNHETVLKLKKENEALKRLQSRAFELEMENKELRQVTKLIKPSRYPYMTVEMLDESETDFVKTAILKAGKSHGAFRDQVAIYEGYLAGRVIDVGQFASRLLMLNDINSRVPVKVLSKGYEGILFGTNSKLLELKYLPLSVTVDIGDVLLTSSEGGVFPENIAVGKVIEKKDDSILVEPYVQVEHLNYIQLIDDRMFKNYKTDKST